ncbi:MAG: TetR/AcrR family transcriptional regulator [Clostridiales bacterium]|nr:TetR/AcrR family transcriptional regulator [Clostridiales bacterium]
MSDKKEKKRELILDTAFELILERGYLNTKIIDIANKAGIGKGTLYEYFESKEALILELVNTRVRRDYEKVCEAMEKAPGSKEKLTEYFRLEIETIVRYRSNFSDFKSEFMNDASEISTKVVEAVHSIIFHQFEAINNVIQQGIEAGEFRNVDPYLASACFMGSISFYLSMLHGGMACPEAGEFKNANFSEKGDAFLDCIFNGLLARGE